MSYIDETLMPGETIVHRSRPHWVIFSTPFTWLVLAILLLIIGPNVPFLQEEYFWRWDLYQFVAFILLLVVIITALSIYVAYHFSVFGITNQRVIMKVGFIHRATFEMYFNRIESIGIYQNILGRVLGYGSIIIHGIGGSRDVMSHVPDPITFRRLVLEQVSLPEAPAAETTEPPQPPENKP